MTRIKVSHNVYDINRRATYKQHRCYHVDEECLCECIDSNANVGGVGLFESGGQQGAYGSRHVQLQGSRRARMPNQGINTVYNPNVDLQDLNTFWASRTTTEAASLNSNHY
jgi:hypothetical protein